MASAVWRTKKSIRAAMAFSSLRACAIGFPISAVRMAASRSRSAASRSPKRRAQSTRSATGRAAQADWAARAAAAFDRRVSRVSSSNSRITCSVAGFTTFSIGSLRASEVVAGDAAVEHDHGAVGPGRLVGGEVDAAVDDVFGAPEAAAGVAGQADALGL